MSGRTCPDLEGVAGGAGTPRVQCRDVNGVLRAAVQVREGTEKSRAVTGVVPTGGRRCQDLV